MAGPGLKEPLKRPAFRRLVLSYAVNELGDWLGIVALSLLVFEETDSAMATTLLFIGTGFVPALLTPVVVARLERPPPRFVLPALYAAEAAAFGVLALLADHFSLAAVVAVATVDGALALTAKSLTRSVSAAMLEPEGELRAGNAVLNVAFTASAAIGPVIAGAVIAASSVQTALLFDAVSFCAIGWIMLTARPLPRGNSEPGRLRERVRAGAGYIRGNPTLRRLLAAQGAAFVFFSAVIPIEVLFAKQTLGAGDTGYGLLLGSWGVGMVLGSIVFAALRRAPLPALLFFSTIAVGRRLSRDRGIADVGDGLRGLGGRRRRQRGPVGRGDERGPGADGGEDAGARDRGPRIDRLRRPGARLRARRPDRDRLQPTGDVPGRRGRRDRDRGDCRTPARDPVAGDPGAGSQ